MMRSTLLLVLTIGLALVPRIADAYMGPGAGITVIGTVIAFIAAILLTIVGFVWYPLKRLMARAKPVERKMSQS